MGEWKEGRRKVSISVGFSGPIMAEGVKVGATAGETITNARANREFLGKVLAAI